ncbi:universal stress protein [Microlunatus ginsengisoli]|uniref:Universal stress protein n=1 Tax=Microlunatus ginsengisoli TaxID=363863 RepID=A0ABP7A7T8_9ACTN
MADWMRVVVGVDGSAESEKALRWAHDEARAHGAELLVVGIRVMLPVSPSPWGGFGWNADVVTNDDTQTVLDSSVRSVLGEGVAGVRTRVVDASPIAAALIEAAEGADLLVVGSRGHGAFAGMLLGSVSLHAVTHARCPVTVVR